MHQHALLSSRGHGAEGNDGSNRRGIMLNNSICLISHLNGLEREIMESPIKIEQDATTMMALVYHGPGHRSWENRAKPVLVQATDAIVRITTTTICGTDLHILKGDLPAVTSGRILGHEGVGIIDEVGANVFDFHKGDKVLISCITSCARCSYCRKGMYSHCRTGGWILGNQIDGTQAEYVRIPHADTSLYALPPDADQEAATMLSDILPTSLECGVLNGQVKPGDIVAIVGAGPIGLAALLTAQLYSPSEIVMIDLDENRLQVARSLGATSVVNSSDGNAVERVMALTNDAGVDVAVEAVGLPETFDICQSIVTAGGRIANVGVHGKPVELHIEKLWSSNITLTTRLVDTVTTPMLLKIVQSGRLDPKKLISHRFELSEIMQAYDTFGNATKERALKVLLTNSDTRLSGKT
jgi:alcohol dehydrogenase